MSGRDRQPGWYHNLRTHPNTDIEIADASTDTGIKTVPVRARVAEPREREPIRTTQKQHYPGFADYETKTRRTIPVVLLDPSTPEQPRASSLTQRGCNNWQIHYDTHTIQPS